MPVDLDDIIPQQEGTSDAQRRLNRKTRYREMREELGLDQADMAEYIGVDPSTWWAWETRGRLPRAVSLRRIHDLTGRDHRWLRGE
jgi:transcriptional regulator with XRE-family HTH domain